MKTPWQQQLIECTLDAHDLLKILSIDPADVNLDTHTSFPLRVSQDFIRRMEPGNPRDPLLLQVLPTYQERLTVAGFSDDPLGEKTANKMPSLLHKYHGRVLLIPIGSCAVNCRYCFRRNFPYQKNLFSRQQLVHIMEYLHQDPSIHEVILSGGDPLVAKDDLLAALIQSLATIPHLKYLRIHTRLPIIIPDRVTRTLTDALTSTQLKCTVVIHCNHPNEISPNVTKALNQLTTHGISLLNQSVLLKDVNDNPHTLMELSHKLYKNNVIPYYLHLLDPVQGTAHFAVDEAEGKKILQHLRHHLPGYLVPRFVKEVAGAKSKTLIDQPF